jgi:SPP1 gp7 family putative phage head morphogenesis protein
MPVQHVETPQGRGFRWGRSGAVYLYGPGRTAEEAAAMALRQGRALAARRMAATPARRGRGPRRDRFAPRVTVAYEATLHARIDLTRRLVDEFAGPAIQQVQRELDARREDAPVRLPGLRIFEVLRAIREGLPLPDSRQLSLFGEDIDEDVTAATDRDVGRLFNIPLATAAGSRTVDQWVSRNVSLITSIQSQSLDEVEALVHAAVSGGSPTRELAADIEARFGVAASRASLIARDQTAKLAGQINRERQTAYGIDSYQWSTSGDPRVRQSHADRAGRIYRWDGAHIHPGEDFQCRCDAIPVAPKDDRRALLARAEQRQEWELALMSQSPTVLGLIPNYNTETDWNAARIAEIRRGVRASVGLR